jgi:putative RNA 2'-phosphotransferase
MRDFTLRMAWLLRHGAGKSGLFMDAQGYASLTDVARALGVGEDAVRDVVRTNNKQRYEMKGDRIRASQGHAREGMPVTLEALEASWAVFAEDAPVFHGTSQGALAGIREKGILPGARTHVHLARTKDSKVGKRANVSVLVEVSPARVRAHGLVLFESANGVILARQVPPDCITRMIKG